MPYNSLVMRESDFSKVMQLDEGATCPHYNRAVAKLNLADWDGAKLDFLSAKRLGVDIVSKIAEDRICTSRFEVARRNKDA